ncbi:MAG: phage tail sheath family protein, partial [Candidatus Electrothrix sp. AUS1_2]|nr:phage tail sheath family protein [Candidatus Electrothrix sp. AUS1_2]
MPVTLTYPGVYIEEVSSGVRTITGVATSITAFIGRAKRGPVDEATTINSFGDYERIFGGLDLNSTMSYAVRDFYLNGGSQAVIVRLFRATDDNNNGKAKITFGGLSFEAASPGSWGNDLAVSIDLDISEELATQLGVELFNLTVTYGKPGQPPVATEKYLNITVQGDSERRIDKVLAAQSSLIKWCEGEALPSNIETIRSAQEDIQIAEEKVAGAENIAGRDAAETKLEQARTALEALITRQEGDDGKALTTNEYTTGLNLRKDKKGLFALENVDLFNLLCIPPDTETNNVDATLIDTAAAYCEKRRAMLIVDPHSDWTNKTKVLKHDEPNRLDQYIITRSKNAALFFPRLKQSNPLNDNRMEEFVPCGAVAGIMARTDTERGVWKSPAGLDATLRGVPELFVKLTDAENGELNPLGVNCLRSFPNPHP